MCTFQGINKTSLDAIEKAAFVLVLDDMPQTFDQLDPSKLDKFGRSMLHGKGYDRWFDKSFTLVVCSNGRVSFIDACVVNVDVLTLLRKNYSKPIVEVHVYPWDILFTVILLLMFVVT